MSADKTISQQIDAIIKEPSDWRSETLSQLRALIKQADPTVVEEVKWKKPSKWNTMHRRITQECRKIDIPQRCSDEGPKETLQYTFRKQNGSCH